MSLALLSYFIDFFVFISQNYDHNNVHQNFFVYIHHSHMNNKSRLPLNNNKPNKKFYLFFYSNYKTVNFVMLQ